MQKVTRLVVQKRNKGRVNVYLDGEFAFGLALVEANRLKIGQDLSEDEVAALHEEDAYHKALHRWIGTINLQLRGEIYNDIRATIHKPGSLWCNQIFVRPDLKPDSAGIINTSPVYEKTGKELGADFQIVQITDWYFGTGEELLQLEFQSGHRGEWKVLVGCWTEVEG